MDETWLAGLSRGPLTDSLLLKNQKYHFYNLIYKPRDFLSCPIHLFYISLEILLPHPVPQIVATVH